MNIFLRKNVFETNSSSTHSLVIAGDLLKPSNDCTIYLCNHEYGWDPDTFPDLESRIAYIFLAIRDYPVLYEHYLDTFKKVLNTVYNISSADYPQVEFVNDSSKPFLFIEDTYGTKSTYGFGSGYVDHQSIDGGELLYLFENEGELLTKFIFGEGSKIHTDNDNY